MLRGPKTEFSGVLSIRRGSRSSIRWAAMASLLFSLSCSSIWDPFLVHRCLNGEVCDVDMVDSGSSDMPSSGASDMPPNGASDLVGKPPTCHAGFSSPTACGQNATVTWNCTNATSCTYSCTGSLTQSGSTACSGSESILVNDASGEHCTLTALGAAGTTTVSASTYCIPQCTGSFGPRPACGGNAKVEWNCIGATSCTYLCTGTSPGSGALACSGSMELKVDSAGQNCTVTAAGPGGIGSTSASTTCM